MITYAMTDAAIAEDLGKRFRDLRLRKNITQEELAERTMTSTNRIKSLEAGKAKLETIIAVLRELGALEDLDSLLPGHGLSPIQIAKMQGKKRQRASGETKQDTADDASTW